MSSPMAPLGFVGRLIQRSHYAYANARVRVRKSKLLPRDTYPKLLKMEIPEITRFIEATEYGRDVNELAVKFAGIDLLENSLNVNEERNYAEIRALAKGEVGTLVGRYLERFDIWNLKTILRGRFWGARPEEMLRELLIEDRDDYEFLKDLMEAEGAGIRGVAEALAAHPRGAPYHKVLKEAEARAPSEDLLLQAYEDALDRAYYGRLLASVGGHNLDQQLFLQFVRKEIDLRNLSVLLRLEWRSDPTPRVLDFLIPGGLELRDADLRRLAEATTRAELVERLKEYALYEEFKNELETALASGSLTPVLLALTRSLADFAQRFSYRNPLSVLPIINYLMRKNLEVRNLRAIARGKQSGLSEQALEGLLVVI